MDLAAGNDGNPNTSNGEDIHPLQQFLVLSSLFKYIEKGKKNLRLVCSDWDNCITNDRDSSLSIQIAIENIYSKKNIGAFRELRSNPLATLKCKNMSFATDSDFPDSETLSFFEEFGNEIFKLKIESSLNQLSIISILHYCNYLLHLEINPSLVTNLRIPKLFQSTWKNPMPHLRSLTIKSTSDHDHIPHNVQVQFELVLKLLEKASRLKTFAIMNYSQTLWEQFWNQFTAEPEISPVVKMERIHLNFGCQDQINNDQLLRLYNPKLNLKVLEIQRLAADVTSEDFAILLQHYSTTLETLKIHKIKNNFAYDLERAIRNGFDTTEKDFQLNFPCKMVKLKHLSMYSLYKYKIRCTAPGNVNVFEQLPNLKTYRARTGFIGQGFEVEKGVVIDGGIDYWDRIFPIPSRASASNLVHNALKVLDIAWCFKSPDIIHEIQRRFPQLWKLTLNVEGSLLNEVADVLSTLKIAELAIRYFENKEGINQFASAITGISLSDCEEYGCGIEKEIVVEVEKVRKSFGDWKSLKKLTFLYIRLPVYDDFVHLTDACAVYGFATWKQLESLTLIKFRINQQQIQHTLKYNSLDVFDLTKSSINVGDSKGELSIFGVKLSELSLASRPPHRR